MLRKYAPSGQGSALLIYDSEAKKKFVLKKFDSESMYENEKLANS